MELNVRKFSVSYDYWQRRLFNPANLADLEAYHHFLLHQKWKNNCPFVLEWPFTDMIQMIEHKIVREHMDQIIEINSKKKKS
jgi:hypothetical protein